MTAPTPDTAFWDERRRHIRTRIGKWLGGRDVLVRGQWLLRDLLQELNVTQLAVLNITGHIIDSRLAIWLEKTVFFTSYPDHRIWCNQLGALAGNGKTSPVAATAAGVLAADSKAYGSKVQYLTVLSLTELQADHAAGVSLTELVARFPLRNGVPSISGFARPVKVADERLEPMRRFSAELGFIPGPYVEFVEALAEHLRVHHQADMNAAAYACAFLMDQGFSAMEVYRIRTADVLSGVLACYGDLYDSPANAFLPQTCTDVQYEGVARRTVPRPL
jgi:citrate synthase